MAETGKLSVETALNKIRQTEARANKTDRIDNDIAALDEETKRLRDQRLRLERRQRHSSKSD